MGRANSSSESLTPWRTFGSPFAACQFGQGVGVLFPHDQGLKQFATTVA